MRNDVDFSIVEEEVDEVLNGLRSDQKYLPCKLFYDDAGSKLFDQICELEEYYPTRTEIGILKDNMNEIASLFDKETVLIEFGSGSSIKTQMLLESIEGLGAYVPIDISVGHLYSTANRLRETYTNLKVVPHVADYTQPLKYPAAINEFKKRIIFFPGSTIGNFTRQEAKEFLSLIAKDAGPDSGLIIGFDLQKEIKVLEDAYNDRKGITAEFNLNILHHLNKKYECQFDVSQFEHYAPYNIKDGRIEMYLRSMLDQKVIFMGEEVIFKAGELVLTEYSYKYTLESFASLTNGSFNMQKTWMDNRNYFCLQYLTTHR